MARRVKSGHIVERNGEIRYDYQPFPRDDETVEIVPVCEECGKYVADTPSKYCQGCNAYREHTQW